MSNNRDREEASTPPFFVPQNAETLRPLGVPTRTIAREPSLRAAKAQASIHLTEQLGTKKKNLSPSEKARAQAKAQAKTKASAARKAKEANASTSRETLDSPAIPGAFSTTPRSREQSILSSPST